MPSGRPRYPGLTPREQEVYDLLRQGLTNREIAERLGISLDGAKYHVSQILMKLDVSTREEAAALGARRRVLGLAGIGALFRKLTLASVTKTTAAVVVFGAIVVVALIAIGLLVTQTRSQDDEEATTPELPLTLRGEPSVFLALLDHIPATGESNLYFSDYAALRTVLGITAPSQDVGAAEMNAYWAALSEGGMYSNPISGAFTTGAATLNEELGLNIANLDQSLHVRPHGSQCGSETVLWGRFDENRVETAILRTSSYFDDVTQKAHNGVAYFSWPGRCVVLSSLGGPGSLVLDNDLVYWSGSSEAALQAMIHAKQGMSPSLADRAEYQLLAEEFASLGIFTAYAQVHADPLWFEPLRELAEVEYGRNAPNTVQVQGYLRPYGGFAVGVGHGEEGTYSVLLFLHANEEDAIANADLLQSRVDSGTRYRGRPWSDTIDRSEIEVDGTVLRARFWGPDPKFLLQAWADLDSLFVSKP